MRNNAEIYTKIKRAKVILQECLDSIDTPVVNNEENLESVSLNSKQITLRELITGKEFGSGQEKVAVIVGYCEKVLGAPVNRSEIKQRWISAKMDGKYNQEYIARAKDKLIRILDDDTCDLTQTGEEFFDDFSKQ